MEITLLAKDIKEPLLTSSNMYPIGACVTEIFLPYSFMEGESYLKSELL